MVHAARRYTCAFIFAVDLDGAGNAVWSNNPSLVSAYRFDGKHLVVGWGAEARIVLNVPDPSADMLGGATERRFVYGEDDLYEDDDEDQGGANDNDKIRVRDYGVSIDAAAFMRSPHMWMWSILSGRSPPPHRSSLTPIQARL